MLSSKNIEQIKEEAETFFDTSRGSHGWDHVIRVYNLAVHIGKSEKADLDVIKVSALLHDIAREEQDKARGEFCHAVEGAKMAEELLKKYDLSQDFIKKVSHVIAAHRFRKDITPETLEAEILRDADKLDSIGAVGIGRAFMFAGEIGSRLHNPEIKGKAIKDVSYTVDDTAYQEYLYKLVKIKDLMHTLEGKRIAEDRHNFMKVFFDTLNREVEGVE